MELQDWYKEAGISEKVYDFCSNRGRTKGTV